MGYRAVFNRLSNNLLTNFGEQGLLRGVATININIEQGVEVDYQIGDDKFARSEYAQTVDVGTCASSHSPASGDTLVVGTTGYKIDAILSDNSYFTRFILVKV